MRNTMNKCDVCYTNFAHLHMLLCACSVREWYNRTGAEAGGANVKPKASKASICSGSNRSSCRSNHENVSGATGDKKKYVVQKRLR